MIAITGAAGFIGSNLVHRLAGLGHDLLLVDHPLTAAKVVNWLGLRGFRFLDHTQFLESLAADEHRPEVVFHLGACSSTIESDWAYLERNNVDYSRAIWKWCAQRGCPFVYASSAATYGDGSCGFDDRTLPTDLKPLNLYGRSKNDFDAWVFCEVATARPTPPQWAGVKFFNVYGPREGHKGRMASVVHHAWRQVLERGKVQLFRSTNPAIPNGEQCRDFVFVADCVDHLLWLWQHPAPDGLYNSGTGIARSFLDLAGAVFTALGRGPDIQFIDMPSDLASRYQNFTRADLSKLRAAGYNRPATPLEIGVTQTVQWLQSNPS